nr:GAP family protein [Actinomadura formosensis]
MGEAIGQIPSYGVGAARPGARRRGGVVAEVDAHGRLLPTRHGGSTRDRAVRSQPEEPAARDRRGGDRAHGHLSRRTGRGTRGLRCDRAFGTGAPVVLYFALKERSKHILDGLKLWMERNNSAIMTVICLILAAKLVGNAISDLSS